MDLTNISRIQLRGYTKKASEMEIGVSYIEKMIQDIDTKITELNKELTKISNSRWKEPVPPKKPTDPHKNKYPKYDRIMPWILIIAGIFLIYKVKQTMLGPIILAFLSIPIMIAFPILIIHIIGDVRDWIEEIRYVKMTNKSLLEQHRLDVQAYPKALEKYNQECINYKNACRNDEIVKQNLRNSISNLQGIKNEVIGRLNEAKRYTQRFYSVGIIHPKYQGLSPMCKFFEYFDTGKCETLKEAMHTYDNEVFQGIVIEKLDILNQSIDSLHYELSNLCFEINQNMKYISSSFDTMNGRLNVINGQLNTQEYYARISSECNKQIATDISTIRFYEDMNWITR